MGPRFSLALREPPLLWSPVSSVAIGDWQEVPPGKDRRKAVERDQERTQQASFVPSNAESALLTSLSDYLYPTVSDVFFIELSFLSLIVHCVNRLCCQKLFNQTEAVLEGRPGCSPATGQRGPPGAAFSQCLPRGISALVSERQMPWRQQSGQTPCQSQQTDTD